MKPRRRLTIVLLALFLVLGFAGTAYADTATAAPSSLAGLTIGIDPGHQAAADTGLEAIASNSSRTKERMSAGAVGVKSGAQEYQITLLVANKLKTLLEDAGAVVVMSRTTHNVSISNAQRAQNMNAATVDCWVRIHCDFSSDSRQCGISTLAPSEASNSGIAEVSLSLADALLTGACEATGAARRSIAVLSGQTAFNWSVSPVATVEIGFLSNSNEEALLIRDGYQTALARGMYNGLVTFFENE